LFCYAGESQEGLVQTAIFDARERVIFDPKPDGPRKTETYLQKQDSCIFGPISA
jgi:hypothetical protein